MGYLMEEEQDSRSFSGIRRKHKISSFPRPLPLRGKEQATVFITQ